MRRAEGSTGAGLAKRKEALKKKAEELATRCGVDVAVVYEGSAPGDDDFSWPSEEEATAILRRFGALPLERRERRTETRADRLEQWLAEERAKLARVQASGVAGALGSWDGSLEGMGEVELRELLASIDVSLAAARSRGLEGQPQSGGAADRARILPGPARADEVAAETSGPVRARGASKKAPRRRKADAGGGVPALPLEENPKAPNAAPVVADQVTAGNAVSAAARGASDGVRQRVCEVDAGGGAPEENPGAPNAAPLVADDAAAGDDVQILQTPDAAAADDDDDAEWMRNLVEALKENPQPSNSAPCCSETEYLYMGGYVMERDAYDFIGFDLEMPPPCIGPSSPEPDDGDGEPLKLWSWE